MKTLPTTENSLVLRTDFSDHPAWESLCEALQKPSKEHGFRAYVECVSDPDYDSATIEQIVAAGAEHLFVFVVDAMAISDSERSVLIVETWKGRGRTFRVVPDEAWSVENNLSLCNVDFEDFADNTDPDGVYRGL